MSDSDSEPDSEPEPEPELDGHLRSVVFDDGALGGVGGEKQPWTFSRRTSIGGPVKSDSVNIHIASWNVGNTKPEPDFDPWLPLGSPCSDADIIVVATQECTYHQKQKKPKQKRIYVLYCRVLRARGLRNIHSAQFAKRGRPFVELTLRDKDDDDDENDVSRRGKVQSTRTKTWKGHEPDWDETLELDVHPDDDLLDISVWHEDSKPFCGNELLGSAMSECQLEEHIKSSVSMAASTDAGYPSAVHKTTTGLKLTELHGPKQQMDQKLYYEDAEGQIVDAGTITVEIELRPLDDLRPMHPKRLVDEAGARAQQSPSGDASASSSREGAVDEDGGEENRTSSAEANFSLIRQACTRTRFYGDLKLQGREVDLLLKSMVPLHFFPGQHLTTQGRLQLCAYVIIDGRCNISVSDVVVATIEGSGQMIGESGLLHLRRTHTITALDNVTAYRLSATSFEQIVTDRQALETLKRTVSLGRIGREASKIHPSVDESGFLQHVEKTAEEAELIRNAFRKGRMHLALEQIERSGMDVTAVMNCRTFSRNEIVAHEGGISDEYFVLCEGELIVSTSEKGFLRTLHPGEGFSEISLVLNEELATTFAVKTDTAKVFCLHRWQYDHLVRVILTREVNPETYAPRLINESDPDGPTHVLEVCVLRAHDLRQASDLKTTSNPYCKLTLKSKKLPVAVKDRETVRNALMPENQVRDLSQDVSAVTSHAKKTLDPIWHETFRFEVGPWSKGLILKVMDGAWLHRPHHHDHHGQSSIPIEFFSHFQDGEVRELSLDLTNKSLRSGRLALRVKWQRKAGVALQEQQYEDAIRSPSKDNGSSADSTDCSNSRPPIDEAMKGEVSGMKSKHFATVVHDHLNKYGQYTILKAIQQWENVLMVFVRKEDVPYISGVETNMVKTQLGGLSGYKGGLVFKMNFRNTSLCFVQTHLAAHEGQGHREERNRMAADVQAGARVGNKELDLSSQFDHVFWCGDLNYRLDLEGTDGKCRTHAEKLTEVKELLHARDWDGLYEHDELRREVDAGRVFAGFSTEPPAFPPTFKIRQHQPVLYHTKRVPSYCDRVLWKSMPGVSQCLALSEFTSAHELQTSDHQPVYAKFVLTVPKSIHLREKERSDVLLGCVAEWHREVHGRWRPFPDWATKAIEVGYEAWLNGGEAKYAIANAPFEPNPLASFHSNSLAQRRALKSAETQRRQVMLRPFEKACCCCSCGEQNAVTFDTVMEVDFARGVAVDTQTGGCRRKCMKTHRAIKRFVPDSDVRVVMRFQSLCARNLQPASGQRLHAIQEGLKELVSGERVHHGVEKQGGAEECQPHVEIYSESLFFHQDMEARTKTDFVHGRDPVWQPHATPVLHTRLNHLESLRTDSHSPRGFDQPDVPSYSSMILNVTDSLGAGRYHSIGTATIAVRDPSSEVISVVPHTNRRHIFRAFDAPLYLNGVDTGGRISGVLEMYERAEMESLTSFSVVKNIRQLVACVLTVVVCSLVYTLQDYVWRSVHEKERDYYPFLMHTTAFTLGSCVGFAVGGFLLDRLGRKMTLILGWLLGGCTVIPLYMLVNQPIWWGLPVCGGSWGVSYGLCMMSSLLALMDTLGPSRKGIATAAHFLILHGVNALWSRVLPSYRSEDYYFAGLWNSCENAANQSAVFVQGSPLSFCTLPSTAFSLTCVASASGLFLAILVLKDTQRLQDREAYQRRAAAHEAAETVEMELKGESDSAIVHQHTNAEDSDLMLTAKQAAEAALSHAGNAVKLPDSLTDLMAQVGSPDLNGEDPSARDPRSSDALHPEGSPPDHDKRQDITSLVAEHETDFHKQQRELSVDHLLYLLQTMHNYRVLWCLAMVVPFTAGLFSAFPIVWSGFDEGLVDIAMDAGSDAESELLQSDSASAAMRVDWQTTYYIAQGFGALVSGVVTDLHNMRKWFGMIGMLMLLASCILSAVISYNHFVAETDLNEATQSRRISIFTCCAGAGSGIEFVVVICLMADHACVEWRARTVGLALAVMTFGHSFGVLTAVGNERHFAAMVLAALITCSCGIVCVRDSRYSHAYRGGDSMKHMTSINKWLVTAHRHKALDLCYIVLALAFCGAQFILYDRCSDQLCLGLASTGTSTAAAVISSMVIQSLACLFVIYVYRVKYKEEHNPRPLLTGSWKFGALGGEGTGISPMEFVIAKKRLERTHRIHKRSLKAVDAERHHHGDAPQREHHHVHKDKHKHKHDKNRKKDPGTRPGHADKTSTERP